MTDLDLLTGTIAAKLRGMPEVEQLYPARNPLLPRVIGTAAGVISALTTDQTVHAHETNGTTFITVSIATAAGLPATSTAAAVAESVKLLLDAASIDRRTITIRVASVAP